MTFPAMRGRVKTMHIERSPLSHLPRNDTFDVSVPEQCSLTRVEIWIDT